MLGIPSCRPGRLLYRFGSVCQGRPDAAKLLAAQGSGGVGMSLIADQYYNKAMERPWSRKEFPAVADWLAANEKPLALLTEATKRPHRYDPLLTSGGETGLLIAGLLPAVQQSREAARAFNARAMLRIGEGDLDGAWQDILACHRLARLEAQGYTLVEMLVAITIDGIAATGDEALLRHPKLSAAQIAKMRADLAKLPPMATMADKIDIGERFTVARHRLLVCPQRRQFGATRPHWSTRGTKAPPSRC